MRKNKILFYRQKADAAMHSFSIRIVALGLHTRLCTIQVRKKTDKNSINKSLKFKNSTLIAACDLMWQRLKPDNISKCSDHPFIHTVQN